MPDLNWIEITPELIAEKVAGKELQAIRTKALGEGQPDPVPGETLRMVDECRGYVGKVYSLAPGNTIPKKLMGACVAILRFRLLTRFPVNGLLTDDRRTEAKEGLDLLKLTARGGFALDEAEEPEESSIIFPGAYGGQKKINMRTDLPSE